MLIAILNDTHCGARNSADWMIEAQGRFYSQIFFPYLKARGIKRILHLGDYYEHRRYVNFKALKANKKHFLDKLEQNGINMDIIPGNHDVFYRNTNEICSLEELLDHHPSVKVHLDPIDLELGSTSIALIPWINAENYARTMSFVERSRSPICAGHFEFTGYVMHAGTVATSGMDSKLFDKFDSVLSGHYHTKSSGGNVHYLGAQYEMTWGDVDDPKFFHVLDTETGEIEAIRNPITTFKKVVYDDEAFDYSSFDYSLLDGQFVKIVVSKKRDSYLFDKFVNTATLRPTIDLKVVEAAEDFSGIEVDDVEFKSTLELMDTFVDSVETDLNKERLKGRLRNLFVEAQAMEET